MSGRYPVWSGDAWIEIDVPPDSEKTVVPNVNALVYRGTARDHVLLQRRDKAGETVRGMWELPGGRWRAGERPDVAVAREVEEETGLVLQAVSAAIEEISDGSPVTVAIARPIAVVNGTGGAYPSLHVLFECVAEGEPRSLEGATSHPTWWQVDELRHAVESDAASFIPQTRAMLLAAAPWDERLRKR